MFKCLESVEDQKMTKELEALGRIKEFYPQWRLSNRNDFELIEKALKKQAKQDEVLNLLFKWFEPQIISEIGKLPRLQIKCGTFTFSYEFENEYDWRLFKEMIAQRKKTK